MKIIPRAGLALMLFCACGRIVVKKKVPLDSSPASFAQVSGVIHHREGIPLAAPQVELWNDSGHTRLHEVKSRLAEDKLSAKFKSRPLPPGIYRVRVTAPRCAIVEKSVEINAYGPPPALEFILEDSREHRREMAVKHYKAGLAHLASSRFKEAAGEFSKSSGWDSFFEPLPKARALLIRAMDRARVIKAKQLEKRGKIACAYFELGRLLEPTESNEEKREELRRRIAQRARLVVAAGDFSDTPSAPGYGEKLRRALGTRLARGDSGLTPAPGPKTAETISGRGIGFDSALTPAEAARLLSAVRAEVIVLARVLSFEVTREAKKTVAEPPRKAGRIVRIANPEYLKWQALASRIKRSAPAPVRDEDADLVSQLSAQVEEKTEKERFEIAVGKPPPEFIEKEEGSEPAPPAMPAAKSAKLNAVYRLITTQGISAASEGAVTGEARVEGVVPGGERLGAESAEKVLDILSARLMELLRAKSGTYFKEAERLKTAGRTEEAVEEAANALMAAPSGPDNGKVRALLKELLP